MKKVFSIIIIGFASGIGGSWVYNNYLLPKSAELTQLPVVNEEIKDSDDVALIAANPLESRRRLDLQHAATLRCCHQSRVD